MAQTTETDRTKSRRRTAEPRIPVSIRITPAMDTILIEAAGRNLRSLSAEIETRLESTFRTQESLGEALSVAFGPDAADLLMVFGRLLRHAPGVRGMGIEDEWAKDPVAFDIAAREVKRALERLRPPGVVETYFDNAEERADRALVGFGKIAPPTGWREES